MSQSVLRTENLVVGYGRAAVLPPLSLEIGAGELWVLAGRNGTGKSTLLRTLLGLLPPLEGTVDRLERASVAYLPQRQKLDPIVPMRAFDVVAEGIESGWSFLRPGMGTEAKRRIQAAMEQTEIAALANQAFGQLSEGQKQRVLLARALASAPKLMVLDEPTAAMDLASEREAIALIDGLRKQLGTAVLLVSHHLPVALEAADRVVFLDAELRRVLVGPVQQVAAEAAFRRQFALPEAIHG